MTADAVVAAVDLGASGGRVIAGHVSRDGVRLHEVSRFPNEPVRAGGTLHWDILRLYADVTAGLRRAAATFPLASAGIDSWAIDYGLLDAAGALIGNPVHYRDARTDGVTAGVPPDELYAVTGIQHLPFNTIYQLRAAAGTPALAAARTLLLIPDLLAYWLTGTAGAEVTNASTTALLGVSSRTWATGLMERAGIAADLFPPLRQPGDLIGAVRPEGEAAGELAGPGGGPLPLVAVASHDTASAVVAVPADGPGFAYISSGTWSLVGLELDAPVLSEASRAANFTNEAGVDGTVRYLRNVSGLWLLQECQRHWGAAAGPVDGLLRAAAGVVPLRFVIDADDPVFLPPGDMPGRIAAWLTGRGRPVPASPAEFTRCILDSLALAYRRALADAQALSGRPADVVHIVGGGSRNDLLCQLTADATGLPVLAGPAEATALGNVLVQGRAAGALPGTLAGLRAVARASAGLRRYLPSGRSRAWERAAAGLLPRWPVQRTADGRPGGEPLAVGGGAQPVFADEFVGADSRVTSGTQTAYVLALHMDLVPVHLRTAAAGHLAAAVRAADWHLTTGFVGVGYLLPVLSAAGYTDVAYRLLSQRTFPSWRYMIDQGATTIWERWDGWSAGGGFQSAWMNSFNHYALGSVGEWLDRFVLGIDQEPGTAGFARLVLRPHPGGPLNRARGSYQSARGLIEAGWQRADGRLAYRVRVPANATARVHLPSADAAGAPP